MIAWLAFVATLLGCLSLLATQRWHGRLSYDHTSGVQKFHSEPTPRIGGIAILSGLAAASTVAPPDVRAILSPMLIAGLPAFSAGLLEDLTRKVGVSPRLLATLGSGLLAWALTGVAMRNTGVAGLDLLLGFTPLAVLFTAFAVGGLANAINIIDGFNGLAGGAVAIMFAALGVMALQVADTTLANTCFLLAMGTLGFLAVNWPFGKIFLGDGGAYLLGFLLAWVAVLLPMRNPEVTAWASLLACAYPVLEVFFSFLRKTRRAGHSPGQPDGVHLHMLLHRRLARRLFARHRKTVQNGMTSPFAWLFTLLCASWAVAWFRSPLMLATGFAACALAYSIVYARLTQFRWPGVAAPGLRWELLARAFPRKMERRAEELLPMQARMYSRPRAMGRSRTRVVAYGLLGISSCFVMFEPAPFDILALVLAMATFFDRRVTWLYRKADSMSLQIVALLLLFAGLQSIPIIMEAHDIARSLSYAAVTAFLIVIGTHVASLYGRGDSRFLAFLAGYLAAATFSSLLAIASTVASSMGSVPDFLLFAGRPKALFKDPNVLGPYLVPAVVVFFVMAGKSRGWRSLAYLLLMVACAAGVLATASRAAWINLGFALGVFLLFAPVRYKLLGTSLALVVSAAVVNLGSGLLSQDVRGSALDLYRERLVLQGYDADRFSKSAEALQSGFANPAGVGPGQIHLRLGAMDPHNTYARMFAENGGASLALFACIVLMIAIRGLRDALRARTVDTWLIASFALLAGTLVNASVVDALHWRHFWIILALCAFAVPAKAQADRLAVTKRGVGEAC